MAQGKAKRTAWQKLLDEGVTPAEADKKYVELVEELKKQLGVRDEASLTEAEKKKLAEARA
jgi:diazepam-binding inhibitor (GABA receptor modulating acyl-CoA-binding protein)